MCINAVVKQRAEAHSGLPSVTLQLHKRDATCRLHESSFAPLRRVQSSVSSRDIVQSLYVNEPTFMSVGHAINILLC